MNERFGRAPVGMVTVADDGTVTAINDATADLLEADAEVPPAPIRRRRASCRRSGSASR